ncbi:MAG: Bax inhibitor-1/YccA family protein [Gammaproteobacteria bacterium]|uniref:Bax inhibitor-1/YccA family protein n=1 Tax=Candidatus Thiopontia autotrophica TaxID=2841688 RepID=A0A8J6TT39_9GAMM|nr:Bax inhibitor-1/YccA family protein [Candidatus Thiopontia autotrophica]MBL6969189.1 Bax inhibitor-1/YccA family protein [Gammaproteobacteria bacterium]
MNPMEQSISRSQESTLATNKVIKSTYTLLSTTLIFSALMAALSVVMQTSPGVSLVSSLGALGLIWLVLPRTANSASGLGVVFAITGLLGFGLGPMLTHYLSMPNGGELIATAFGGTGIIFLGLSGYALTTQKDFSFMGGFLIAGLMMALVVMLANIFFNIPALSLAISGVIIMLMSGFILYDTSRMIHDPNANYIMMTVGLYLNIFNLFVHLLHILGAMRDD